MHFADDLQFLVSAKLLWIISAKLMPCVSMLFVCWININMDIPI